LTTLHLFICLLFKAGADITAVNKDGMTAAEVAHENNRLGKALLKELQKASRCQIVVVVVIVAVAHSSSMQ
jgi:F420-0:gamma-glutamyl ligase-like protein